MVVKLGGEVKLSISDVVRVARLNEEVALSEEALGLMRDSRAVLEGLVAKGVSIYGVNTGLGELYNVTVGLMKLPVNQWSSSWTTPPVLGIMPPMTGLGAPWRLGLTNYQGGSVVLGKWWWIRSSSC
jgi:hypothetical protein